MTSSEVVEAPAIGVMPSASPISDFPNTFVEPEMLSLSHPSMSKGQGFHDCPLYSSVGGSHLVSHTPRTTSTTNNTTTNDYSNNIHRRMEINDGVHEDTSTMPRVGYNPVQQLNAMTEHSMKDKFLATSGLCQLMTGDKRSFYNNTTTTTNNNNNNNTSNSNDTIKMMNDMNSHEEASCNNPDSGNRTASQNSMESDHIAAHDNRHSDMTNRSISAQDNRHSDMTNSSISNTRVYPGISASSNSCHGLESTKIYTNLDSHKNNFRLTSIRDEFSHGRHQSFTSSLSQSPPLSLSPTSLTLSSSSSTINKSPSSSPSCMYVSSHHTSSPVNHSILPINMADADTFSHLVSVSACSGSSVATYSQSYVSGANEHSSSNHVTTVTESHPKVFGIENDDSCSSRIRKKGFLCEPQSQLMEEDSESLMSWSLKSPDLWTQSEVLDWLFHVAQERDLDMQKFRPENFQSISGSQLSCMDREDFIQLEPTFGLILYEMMEKLLAGDGYTKAEASCCYRSSTPSPVYSQPDSSQYYDLGQVLPTNQSLHEATHLFNEIKHEEPCVYQDGIPPQEQYFKQELSDNTMSYNPYSYEMNDSSSSLCLPISQAGPVYPNECYLYQGPYSGSHPASVRPPYCYSAPPPPPPQAHLPRRKPGRPRVKNLIHTNKTTRDKKVKNQHLWEFIYEVLMNPLYNPKYLRWENQREGIFRFVQSEAVAQLWGGRKNNENMTYEKLSRAMRHYYRRGILERVEGRRLVYKFSLKAIDRMKSKKSNSQQTC